MHVYTVTYYVLNSYGDKLGSEPVVLRFYSSSSLNTEGILFQCMLLEYGRAIGRSGSTVEIVSIES